MEPFVNEERIPLLDNNDDEAIDDESVRQDESSFIDSDPSSDIKGDAKRENMQQAIEEKDKQINALERNFNVDITREQRTKFRLVSGILQVEKPSGEYVNITKSNGEFIAESTMRNRLGSTFARELLGIKTPKIVKVRSRILYDKLPTEIEMEDLSTNKIEEVIDEVTSNVDKLTEVEGDESVSDEIRDRIIDRIVDIKGELANNALKLTELDEHIKKDINKLTEVEGDESVSDEIRDCIRDRIADLKKERSARLEIISNNKKELASQFSRIRQTVEKILDEDLTLREKIKLVFREHGLTITAVLTSLGLIISTIIGFLTGGGSSGGSPPKHPNKLKEWVKNKLKALARVLGRLAGKAVAALPGIIGSLVAGILNFLKKVVVAASQHVWLFLTSIATLIGYRILYPPKQR